MAIAIDDSAPGPDPRSAATAERQWVFPMGSKADVVMPDGVHRYWSTHCRHGNHDLCKGTCKGCAAMCICGCGCNPRPVEGSTPIASPAQCGHGIAVADAWLQCQNTPDHDGLHISGRRRWRTGGTLESAGEVVSVPPPAEAVCCVDAEPGPDAHGTLLHTLGCRNRCGVDTTWYPPTSPLQGSPYACGTTVGHEGDHWAPPALRTPQAAVEPVSVAPPVDALLKLVAQYGQHTYDEADGVEDAGFFASGTYRRVEIGIEGLWAAGVGEGRRQHAEDVERLQVLLDHAEQYARDLQDNGVADHG